MDIESTWETFLSLVFYKVSSGNRVRFWEDNWADSAPLASLFPDFYSMSNMKGRSIAECWKADSLTWDLAFRRNLFERELERWALFTEKLDGVVLGQGLDKLWWKMDSNGVFSTNSACFAMTSPSPKMSASTSNQIWNFRVLKQVKVFL